MKQKALAPEELRTWTSFLRASTRLFVRLEAELGPHGLTLADYEILVVLSESPDRRLRMCDLAANADVSASRLTHRVNRLVAEGLVQRDPCPEDKRVTYAVLTEEGFDRLREAYPTHLAGVRRYFTESVPNSSRAVFERIAAALGAAD